MGDRDGVMGAPKGGGRGWAVAWRAGLLLPLLLLARGDFAVARLPGHGVQGQLLTADPWLGIWLTPHLALHLVLYDDLILAATAAGMALLWVLMRDRAPATGVPLLMALVGPGAACG
jgi:hypothetical protein